MIDVAKLTDNELLYMELGVNLLLTQIEDAAFRMASKSAHLYKPQIYDEAAQKKRQEHEQKFNSLQERRDQVIELYRPILAEYMRRKDEAPGNWGTND